MRWEHQDGSWIDVRGPDEPVLAIDPIDADYCRFGLHVSVRQQPRVVRCNRDGDIDPTEISEDDSDDKHTDLSRITVQVHTGDDGSKCVNVSRWTPVAHSVHETREDAERAMVLYALKDRAP